MFAPNDMEKGMKLISAKTVKEQLLSFCTSIF